MIGRSFFYVNSVMLKQSQKIFMINLKSNKPIVARNYIKSDLITNGELDKVKFEEFITSKEFGEALSAHLDQAYDFCLNQDYYYFGTNQSADFRPDNSREPTTLVNYASYITSLFTSFLTTKPVEYQTTNGDGDQFADFEVDYQAVLNGMSKYGKVYVLTQISGDEKDNRVLQPYEVFEIRDSGLDEKLVARIFITIEDDHYTLHAFTTTSHITLYLKDNSAPTIEETVLHPFNDKIPIVEFVNNADQMDDYFAVRNLINFYNVVQSGRINDRQALLDALLLAYGMNMTEEQIKDMKKHRTLAGIPKDAKLEYLIKNIQEGEIEEALKSIKQDIHRIAKVPDFSDENMYASTSGIAMKYRLFLFDQKASEKKTNLANGLLNLLNLHYDEATVDDVQVVISDSLPSNDLEISQMIANLDGKVDTPTLISQLSFVEDGNEIYDLAKAEQEFGDDVVYNEPIKEENGELLATED